MTTTTVGAVADDQRHGMTLDELAAFLETARRYEIPGETLLHVRVNLKGGIKRIETRAQPARRADSR